VAQAMLKKPHKMMMKKPGLADCSGSDILNAEI
jgi:hypothetical protein